MENQQRKELRDFLERSKRDDALSPFQGTIARWVEEVRHLEVQSVGDLLLVERHAGDPAWANEKQTLGKVRSGIVHSLM